MEAATLIDHFSVCRLANSSSVGLDMGMRVSVCQGVSLPTAGPHLPLPPGFDTSSVWDCAKLLILSEPQCTHLQNGSVIQTL